MSNFINVVILTMSEKFGKKCVAAYDIDNKRLVRLVSNEQGDGISQYYLSEISLLDIVRVNVICSAPIEHQRENFIIDLNYGISKQNKTMSIKEIHRNIPHYQNIFGNNSYKVFNADFDHSIELIQFTSMQLISNIKTKATFMYNNFKNQYYAVTDSRYFGKNTSIISGHAIVSIPPSSNYTKDNGYFKFIAAIFPDDTEEKNFVGSDILFI